jgi:sterol desaturase/sphingolipid hydroxylase (fatty acid hydroxylase superfamily)
MSILAELLDFRLFLVAAFVFIPLERLFAERKAQKLLRDGWANDLVYVFVNGIVIRIGLVLVVLAFLTLSALAVPSGLRDAVASQPLWLQTIEVLLLADLGFYLTHRAFHRFPILWRFHTIHHSIEEMDWLAAARVHPIDQIITKSISLLPCFALGFSEWAIGAFALLYHWHSLLLHSNVPLGFGPFKWLIASPDFHHWHHAREREAWDRNFAGQLALWDFIFGTAHLPKGRRAQAFGVADPVPAGYAAQLLHPFRRPGSEAAPGNG